MVDIRWEGRSQRSAPQKRHKAPRTRLAQKLRLGRGGKKSHCTWRECAREAPGYLSCLDRGRHSTQAQLSQRLCGVPENLNLSGFGLGSAHNSGLAPCRATWSLSSVDGESTQAVSGANPVWPEHCECSPHRPVIFVCSTPPSPQHDWKSKPKQEITSTHLCHGGN